MNARPVISAASTGTILVAAGKIQASGAAATAIGVGVAVGVAVGVVVLCLGVSYVLWQRYGGRARDG
jgi:hypothetical protein